MSARRRRNLALSAAVATATALGATALLVAPSASAAEFQQRILRPGQFFKRDARRRAVNLQRARLARHLA